MIIEPKIRGFICTTAHPTGCAQHVQTWIDTTLAQPKINNGPKKVLVIGASTGYGLASRIAACFGADAQTIGVFFEKPSNGKRTASAGWYNAAAFEEKATAAGHYAKSINGDAFSNEIKRAVIDLIKKDWGGEVDCVIYSLASPVRKHPDDGELYRSALKPIGADYSNKTIDMMTSEVSTAAIEQASETDIKNTVTVMGGDDWYRWMQSLHAAGVLAEGCKTVSYSYIGPAVTQPIYRNGTIGQAKEDMEATAEKINTLLGDVKGEAYVSVNKALITQASAAIPIVPLYISLLYKIMKEKGTHEGCMEQMNRLFSDRLYGNDSVPVDEAGRIRIDDWEMDDTVQSTIDDLWDQVTDDTVDALTDIAGCKQDFIQLFGFDMDGVNYGADVDPVVNVPSIETD